MAGPSDPFGANERTIIVPSPRGRRPAPADAPATPAAASPPPAAPLAASRQPAFAPAAYVPPSPAGRDDDWATSDLSRPPPPVPPQPAERGRALVMKRDVVVAANENPFLRAAGPLLLLLGRLRVGLSRASFANLMEQVAASVEDFERDAHGTGLTPDQIRTAKYIVCATADDIVQNIPTDERHVWAQYSMLSRFFGERIGGVRFFQELERAGKDPTGNYHLLELMYACLALGFRGIHGTEAGGAATLQAIQRNLYETLRRVRSAEREVSPRWQGQAIAPAASRFEVPVWAVASVVGVALLGLYLLLRTLLAGDAEAAATALVTVHPTSEVGIQRRIYAPPPPPPPPPPASPTGQVRTALASEISSGQLVVQDQGNQLLIRVAAALFAPGDATLKPEFAGLIRKVAGLVDKSDGPIRVVGHTDSTPIRTVRFASNFALSQERAKAVAATLKAGLAKPDRVEMEGKGADVPIAPNATPDGRAKNRRVEILVPRGQ